MPLTPTEQQLRAILGPMVFDYYAGGAEDETTLRANAAAWKRWRLVPHVAEGTRPSPAKNIELLPGTVSAAPLMLAPCALAKLAHPGGESAVAKAAATHSIPMVVSTTASETIEETATAASDAILWFQLYAVPDRAITADLVARAQAAGCKAIVVTVDTPALGRRERDMRNQFSLPPGIRIANLERYGNAAYNASRKDPALTWEIVPWLRTQTNLPIVLKGVLCPEDARLAVEHGVDAVVVSNHGGRQLDGVPATADALPGIRDAVDARIKVFVDGGIRSGSDVVRAVALGADAAWVGRPWLWALAEGGEGGVANWLQGMLDEIRRVPAGVTLHPSADTRPSG